MMLGIGLGLIVLFDGNPATGITGNQLIGVDPLVNFVVNLLAFVSFFLATLLVVRFIHQRPARSLISPATTIKWKRLFTGMGLWFILAALMAVVEALLFPGRYLFTLDLAKWIPFAVVALLLVPIQTSAEELFFRGYFIQNLGLRLKNPYLIIALSGLLFVLPHLANPEVSVNPLLVVISYFAIGAFTALVTLRDNGLELALGYHAGNNLFAFIFANCSITPLKTPSVFTIQTLDPVYGLITLLVAMAAFYILVFRHQPSSTSELN